MSIPVMQIFRESFSSFKGNKLSWLRLAFAPFMLYIFGFFIIMMAGIMAGQHMHTGQVVVGFWSVFAHILNFIFSIIAAGSLYINGYRYGILKEGGDNWWLLQMNMRLVKLILYSLLIGLMSIGFVLVGAGIVIAFHMMFHSIFLDVLLGLVIGVFGLYALIRLTLTFPLISIERENPLRSSWNMLHGNVLRLFGLSLIIGLAIFGIMLLGFLAISLVGYLLFMISPVLLFIPIIAGVIFMAYIWLLNYAVMTKAISLVYLSFTKGNV